ncbi:A24 family peptidase [Noviherbaspirillum sp.]|uniref:A24 family peptidase n=1 Tax=Noviherbaspirillum sp. TaxID=1926288 RepID=UPI002FE23891
MSLITPSLIAAAVVTILCSLLLCAVITDIKAHRISNRLVFIGACAGIAFNTTLPEGYGFVSVLPGALGFWGSLCGLGAGLGLMLPLYLLRAMGAGDVKLMAMVGAFLGAHATLNVVLSTFVIGGFLCVAVVLRNRMFALLLNNLRTMLLSAFFKVMINAMPTVDAAPSSAGKLPYGVAIAAGTIACVVLTSMGIDPANGYWGL